MLRGIGVSSHQSSSCGTDGLSFVFVKAAWRFHQCTHDPVDTNVAGFPDRAALEEWAPAHRPALRLSGR
ncbi:hypothetical protein APS67_005818 [Streptomyces sp. AVP053U2]|uniref:hypothetical protein n=1 Tax=unclassified Streptomyces TaxID=2593676 RepID=UPI0005A93F91|nr:MULTISPECIES: hypothetical protein [unclassified Streptomyces]ODA70021.1 hypothetical protein APS67_005818 [Streptomyces sp. AVP053U2]